METSTKFDFNNFTKISLVVFAFLFSGALLFYRGFITNSNSLDKLARRSLDPEIALINMRPTIFEFYADWCEVCQQMAPDMLRLEEEYKNSVDIVLLNVDNERWINLIDQYHINGIPFFSFFDSNGNFIGSSAGLRNSDQINLMVHSLSEGNEIPFLSFNNEVSTNITKDFIRNSNSSYQAIKPRTH